MAGYAFLKRSPYIRDESDFAKHTPFIWHGSAWVEHPSYVYSERTEQYLYNAGNEYTDLTGGWMLSGLWGSEYAYNGSLTKNSGDLTVYIPGHGSDFLRCTNKIDLTNFNKIKLSFSKTESSCTIIPCIATDLTEDSWVLKNIAASTAVSGTHSGEIIVDVSSVSGTYYLGVGMTVEYTSEYGATFTITQVKLE